MTVRTISQVVPGVGMSHAVELRDGHRIVVVTRRDGDFDVSTDSSNVRIDEDEADSVAALLGSAKVMSRLQRLREVDGLHVEQVAVPLHSPYAGLPLSATRLRSRTGASVVAVLRDGAAQPAPKPEFVLEAGDLVIAVGTRVGLDQVGHILDGIG